MKSCAVLASLLFGLCAVAAPVDKRAVHIETVIVTQTVFVTSTVYEGDEPAATPTPPGEFYGKPAAPEAKQTPPAYAPVAAKPSSAPSAPAPKAPVVTPAPVASPPVPEPAKPTSSAPAYVAPSPEPAKPSPAPAYVAPSPQPQPSVAAASSGSTSSGEEYSNVDITIYQTAGAAGACGDILNDTDMIVALAQPAWGASTYDTMTGSATNRWCRKKVEIEYHGNKVQAQIMDMCPGCSGHDLDLSPAVWKKLTGSDEMTRYKASWRLLN